MNNGILAAAVILALAAPAAAQQGTGSADLHLEPANLHDMSLGVGTQFQVSIMTDVDYSQPVVAADLVLTYDPAMLELVSFAYGDFFVTPIDMGPMFTTDGYYYLSASDFGRVPGPFPAPPMVGTYRLVELTFEVLADGSSPLTLTGVTGNGHDDQPWFNSTDGSGSDGIYEGVFSPLQSGHFSNVGGPTAPEDAAQLAVQSGSEMQVGFSDEDGRVYFRSTVAGPVGGGPVWMEVEVKPIEFDFDGAGLHSGTQAAPTGATSVAVVDSLGEGGFHWRYRAVNAGGVGIWTAFDPSAGPDFVVEFPPEPDSVDDGGGGGCRAGSTPGSMTGLALALAALMARRLLGR